MTSASTDFDPHAPPWSTARLLRVRLSVGQWYRALPALEHRGTTLLLPEGGRPAARGQTYWSAATDPGLVLVWWGWQAAGGQGVLLEDAMSVHSNVELMVESRPAEGASRVAHLNAAPHLAPWQGQVLRVMVAWRQAWLSDASADAAAPSISRRPGH